MSKETERLKSQCEAILRRLRSGRVSNAELAGIALKYTGRISDLRAKGFVIECVERNRDTGQTWYELTREPSLDPQQSLW